MVKRVTFLIHTGSSNPVQEEPWIILKLFSPKSDETGWMVDGAVRSDQTLAEIRPEIITVPYLLPAELEKWLQGNCDTDKIGSVEDIVTTVLCRLLLYPAASITATSEDPE